MNSDRWTISIILTYCCMDWSIVCICGYYWTGVCINLREKNLLSNRGKMSNDDAITLHILSWDWICAHRWLLPVSSSSILCCVAAQQNGSPLSIDPEVWKPRLVWMDLLNEIHGIYTRFCFMNASRSMFICSHLAISRILNLLLFYQWDGRVACALIQLNVIWLHMSLSIYVFNVPKW